jgi:hypothetical protein
MATDPSPSPQKYWTLWNQFLRLYVIPLLNNDIGKWQLKASYRFNPAYYKHRSTPDLYHIDDNHLTLFKLFPGAQSRLRAIYVNVPCICDIPFSAQDFFPIDIHHHSRGMSIIGDWPVKYSHPDSFPMNLEAFIQSNHPQYNRFVDLYRFLRTMAVH